MLLKRLLFSIFICINMCSCISQPYSAMNQKRALVQAYRVVQAYYPGAGVSVIDSVYFDIDGFEFMSTINNKEARDIILKRKEESRKKERQPRYCRNIAKIFSYQCCDSMKNHIKMKVSEPYNGMIWCEVESKNHVDKFLFRYSQDGWLTQGNMYNSDH